MAAFTQSALQASTYWTGLSGGAAGFVLVSDGYDGAFSADGISWSAITLPHNGYSSVRYGAGLFIATSGGNKYVATSADGVTWTPRTTEQRFGNKMAFANGRFFADLGDPTFIYTSTDGITWTAISTPVMPNSLKASFSGLVAYFNGRYVSPVAYSTYVLVSTNGTNWSLEDVLPSSGAWNRLACNGASVLIAAQDSTRGCVTTDGVTWGTATLPTDGHSGLVSAGTTYFLLQAYSSTIHESEDGLVWAGGTLPVSANWGFIADSGSCVAAVVQNSTVTAYYQYTSSSLSISGTVRDGDGNFVARTVRVYLRSSGELVGETTSDASTGAFSIDVGASAQHYAICLDDDLSENALIFDGVTPA